MEMLADDVEMFSKEISSFLDIDYKKTTELLQRRPANKYDSRENRFRRFRGNFFYRVKFHKILPEKILRFGRELIRGFLLRLPHKKTVPSKELTKEIRAIYGSSNKKLADELDLPLSKYGYPV